MSREIELDAPKSRIADARGMLDALLSRQRLVAALALLGGVLLLGVTFYQAAHVVVDGASLLRVFRVVAVGLWASMLLDYAFTSLAGKLSYGTGRW